jgi:hypothetical protein
MVATSLLMKRFTFICEHQRTSAHKPIDLATGSRMRSSKLVFAALLTRILKNSDGHAELREGLTMIAVAGMFFAATGMKMFHASGHGDPL